MLPVGNTASTLTSLFNLQRTQQSMFTAMERLATGSKINAGKDGPAALISSEHLAAELAALEAESQSLQREYSNANITEGRASEVSSMLTELNGLITQGANAGNLSDAERDAIQLQIDNTVSSIQRMTGDTVTSLDGISLPDDGNTQVADTLTTMSGSLASLTSGGANSLASGNFEDAQTVVASAISDVATTRGTIGAHQAYNIAPQIASNQIAMENISASKSIISDTDYAVEMSNLIRGEILSGAGIRVLKMAQQNTSMILDLLSSER
jgi:flagellin